MLWQPRVTGDWSTDNATGREMVDQIVGQCLTNPTLLGHVMKSMVGHGDWTGVEVGFFHRISEHLTMRSTQCQVEHDNH